MATEVIQKRYAIIEAPSVLGLRPTGVERLATTLLEHGLAARLQARHHGRVEPLPWNDGIMPAVEYRLADGLVWDELRTVLTTALSSGRAVGLELTIYNPALDEAGRAGRALTDMLAAALGTSVPSPLVTTGSN